MLGKHLLFLLLFLFLLRLSQLHKLTLLELSLNPGCDLWCVHLSLLRSWDLGLCHQAWPLFWFLFFRMSFIYLLAIHFFIHWQCHTNRLCILTLPKSPLLHCPNTSPSHLPVVAFVFVTLSPSRAVCWDGACHCCLVFGSPCVGDHNCSGFLSLFQTPLSSRENIQWSLPYAEVRNMSYTLFK